MTDARAFRKTLYAWYKIHGRHSLPWRQTTDPYAILVSEIMLQQTQVDRVIPKYEAFLKKFPTVKHLARAKDIAVLKIWQGLGYNRRALFLKRTAETVTKKYGGVFPMKYSELRTLPGVGAYTASAISAFAYNISVPCIETNIRTVCIHHFFKMSRSVPDAKILKTVEQLIDTKNPRKFYSAIMDYGTHLKKTGNTSYRKAKAHVAQPPLKGSVREVRGYIITLYTKGASYNKKAIVQRFGSIRETKAREGLIKDKLLPCKFFNL